MITTAITTTITRAQADRAHRLARAHGHAWGTDAVRAAIDALPSSDSPITLGEIAALVECDGDCGAVHHLGCNRAGIIHPHVTHPAGWVLPIITHTSTTGRLRWTVDAAGTTTIEVWRPHPSIAVENAIRDRHLDALYGLYDRDTDEVTRAALSVAIDALRDYVPSHAREAYESGGVRVPSATVYHDETPAQARLAVDGWYQDRAGRSAQARYAVRHVDALAGALSALADICTARPWADRPAGWDDLRRGAEPDPGVVVESPISDGTEVEPVFALNHVLLPRGETR